MQSIAPAPTAPMHTQDADNDLRAQLAASLSHQSPIVRSYDAIHASPDNVSPHHHNIDPAIGGGQMMVDTQGDDYQKGGRRELSQSKRAAQNRVAQRAFRQRKEGYIKKLEEQCRELHILEESHKALQAENYSLREYIIHLQSRLLETQSEIPPAPPNVNLNHPVQARRVTNHGLSPERDLDMHPSPVVGSVEATSAGRTTHDGLPRGDELRMPTSPIISAQATAARSLAVAGLKREQQARALESINKKFKGGHESDEEVIHPRLKSGKADLPAPM